MMDERHVYHGNELSNGYCRIQVETSHGEASWGEKATVLYELAVPQSRRGGLNWGYNGGGTSTSAAAILADALGLGDLDETGWNPIGRHLQEQEFDRLREDFCIDFLAQFCREWRLDRAAVLRWARGWYAQSGIRELPVALRNLPPLGD